VQRRLANIDTAKVLTEPAVIVFVGMSSVFDDFLEKLVTAIGPGCPWSSEQEFCEYTGCAPWNLEGLVGPRLGSALSPPGTVAGRCTRPVPWVLYKVTGSEHQVRVFSAGPELAEWLGSRDDARPLVQ